MTSFDCRGSCATARGRCARSAPGAPRPRRRSVGGLERRDDRPARCPGAKRILGAVDDEALERELGSAHAWLRPAASVWRRSPARPVPARRRAAPACRLRRAPGCPRRAWSASSQRALRDFHGLRREDEIPVRVADVRPPSARPWRAADSSDMSWLICVICSCCRMASIRKLRSSGWLKAGGQRRVERRVEVGKQVDCVLPAVVEPNSVAAAAPLQVLRTPSCRSTCRC